MENNMHESVVDKKDSATGSLDHGSADHSSVDNMEKKMARGSLSSILAIIIASIMLNITVTASMIYYYHNRYATKIVAFDFERFKNMLVDEIVTGGIQQEDSVVVLNNLKHELSNRTKGSNTLILLREVIVNGDVEEIDPTIQWLKK
ncbi:MAG: hypothetical protein WAZ30_00885 [Syntrophorhabdus sp.]|jgi:lipopolysaccharide/colanic/teichoic acid biosynthesis glycosyltransferase